MTGIDEASSSTTGIVGRKLRALAIHGGYSNSNILKFQLAQLRKHLGKDVEWVMPDALVPLHPYADSPEDNMFPEMSEFEARLAQGKPLVSWYVLRWLPEGVFTDDETWESGSAILIDVIEREAPIDLVVGFSQGALTLTRIALRFQREGRPIPWRLAVFFCPSDPTNELKPLEFTEFLHFPALHITSPGDPHFLLSLRSYAKVFPESLWTRITHEDGYAFPTTGPRAAEIYRTVAEEVRRYCWRGEAPPAVDDDAQPPEDEQDATSKAALDRAANVGKEGASQHQAEEKRPKAKAVPDDVATPVTPEELAMLCLAGACIVVDTRSPETRGSRLFPGCDPREDLSFAAMQRGSKDLQRRLTHRVCDGQQIVAVSRLGDLDREYCDLLVGSCGLPARRARWLAGGLRAWASWELDRPTVAEQVRLAAGLPRRREAAVPSLEPAALAQLLRERRCLVVDAREAAETRGKAFPSACKGLSFQTLRRRPEAARQGLERLREDGRAVVVVSTTGGRCGEYCGMLVDQFGFREDTVSRLEGGLRAWAAWEMENAEASEELRHEYGLPPARCSLAAGPEDSARRAAERDLSVDALDRYS